MKKIATAVAVTLALSATSVQAQSLQPQMSSQDVRSAIDPEPGHLLVPILMMVFLVATAAGGSSGGAVTATASDERLKTDITPVGLTAHGLTLYDFRYVGMPEVWRGVMAQEVAEVMPGAVHRHATGYLMIDYDALGITMQRVH